MYVNVILAIALSLSQTLSPTLLLSGGQGLEQGGAGRTLQNLTTETYELTPFEGEAVSAELAEEYKVRIPLDDYYVTSEFGHRCDVEDVYSGCLHHSGIDFGNGPSIGRPAFPTASGIVTLTQRGGGIYPGCGNYVAIYHPAFDLTTFYCHLADIYVSEGQTLDYSTPLGEIGTTGMSNGVHLHFMTVWGSNYMMEPFNPREWFAMQGVTV